MHRPRRKAEAARKGEVEMQRIGIAGSLGVIREFGGAERTNGPGRQFFAGPRRGTIFAHDVFLA